MDQAKWAIPRCRRGQLSKTIAKFDRPKTKVQGLWLHGIAMFLFALCPKLPADGSMVAECLCRSLDYMFKYCEENDYAAPRRMFLWVCMACLRCFQNHPCDLTRLTTFCQVDNTVKESKNNTMFKLLCYILLQRGLEVCGIFMSRVGHTHCCLGNLTRVW